MKYGIGELYGKDISRMSPDDIRQWASQDQKYAKCPFKARTSEGDLRHYNKSGGVGPEVRATMGELFLKNPMGKKDRSHCGRLFLAVAVRNGRRERLVQQRNSLVRL